MLLAALALPACSPPTVVRASPAAPAVTTNSQGGLAEPSVNETVIVINNNAMGGNHAGIFAGLRLNDPAGSYVGQRSQDKDWPGPSLADYVEFQKADGERIQIYRFQLTRADFAELDARMASASPTPPLFCASDVQNLIAGLGPFGNIQSVGWTSPASLAELLDGLTRGPAAAGVCVMPDKQPCQAWLLSR